MKKIVELIYKTPTSQAISFGALTWLAAFGYQIFFYYYYLLQGSSLVTERNVFSYYSGIIGDGMVVPALNILTYLLLKSLRVSVNLRRIVIFSLLGIGVTLLVYLAQASLALTNWSMPTPYVWSGMGKAHFLFMWFEFSFLFFTLYEVTSRLGEVRGSRSQIRLFLLSLLLVALFLALFAYDYNFLPGKLQYEGLMTLIRDAQMLRF